MTPTLIASIGVLSRLNMNSFIAILVVSTFFTLSGWYLSYLVPKLDRLERLGLSFLLGVGLTTFLWFLGSRVGLPFDLPTLGLSGFIPVFIGFVISKLLRLKVAVDKPIKFNQQEKTLAILVAISLILAFAIGSYRPLTAWDSIALYDFRGHAIAMDHDLSFIRQGAYFMSYPLMISLVHAAVYLLGGISAQGIHAIIFAAFIAIIYGRMKSWTNPTYALFTCLLIIAQNEIFGHATFAYTNLPYTSYLVAGLLYVISGGSYNLVLGGIMLALSTWIRSSEVFWIIGVILMVWQGLISKKFISSLLGIALIIVLRLTWSTYVGALYVALGHANDPTISHFTFNSLVQIFHNLKEICWYLYLNVLSPYLGIWFLFLPSLLVFISHRNTKLLMFLSSIFMAGGMVTAGVMVFSTYYDTWDKIGDSAKRMMLFIIPLSLIMAVYALYLSTQKKYVK